MAQGNIFHICVSLRLLNSMWRIPCGTPQVAASTTVHVANTGIQLWRVQQLHIPILFVRSGEINGSTCQLWPI